MPNRIRSLDRARLIHAIETAELTEGWKHLTELRCHLTLQGHQDAILPENPDKLYRLASAMGYDDGNAFLMRHQAVTGRIRQIYEDGMKRLNGE